MIDRLFVYGTLAPGRVNQHVLAGLHGAWVPATVRGTLLQEGWGAAAGYPGIVLSEQGQEVSGFLFTSSELPDHWARIDEFEGEGYVRVLATVQLVDGIHVQAHVYALRAAPDGKQERA